jgi:uncharacterized protein (TIGR02452 family)
MFQLRIFMAYTPSPAGTKEAQFAAHPVWSPPTPGEHLGGKLEPESREIASKSSEWNAASWLEEFERAAARRDGGALRSLRAAVFRSTAEAIRRRGYEAGGSTVQLDSDGAYEALHRGTAFYPSTDPLEVHAALRDRFRTFAYAEKADCLEVAERLGREAPPPAVLNMASPHNPGGGVLVGAGAQEENLFRRSTLLRSLFQFAAYHAEYDVAPCSSGHRYPIPLESGGIYSPPTAVFRSSEATGYAFLPEPYPVAFLTVPAISRPALVERDGQLWLADAVAEATRRKIRAILRIAARQGHVDLVLSAFGCGAFRNPPHHVAQLFRETLAVEEFSGVFRRIVFAILDDHNARGPHSPDGNYAPFAREFGGISTKPSD